MRKVISILFITYTISTIGQKNPIEIYTSIKSDTTLTREQKIDRIKDLLDDEKFNQFRDTICYDFSRKIYKTHIKEAIYFSKKAQEKFSITTKNKDLYKRILTNLTFFYYRDHNYNEVLKLANSFIAQFEQEEDRYLRQMYERKGQAFRTKGNILLALESYYKLERIFNRQNNYRRLLKTYINILQCYISYDSHIYSQDFYTYVNKIEQLKIKYEFPITDRVRYKINLGYFFDEIEMYQKALESYNQALFLSLEHSLSKYVCSIYIDLSVLYKKLNNLDISRDFLKNALPLVTEEFQKAAIYNNMAELNLLEEDYPKAIENFHKAISVVLQNDNPEGNDLPNFEEMSLTSQKVDLIGYLVDYARAWQEYGKAENNKEYTQKALETLELADQLMDLVYFENREELSKLFWREKGNELYNKAVTLAYQLDQKGKAFYYIEKSKAQLLLENLTDFEAKQLAGLPESVINKEFKLFQSYNNSKQLLKDSQGDSLIDILKDEIYSKREAYNQFIDSLEISYPSYFNYKRELQVQDASKVQQLLRPDELLLQYKFTKNDLYLSLLTRKMIKLYKIPNAEGLKKSLVIYREMLKKPFVNQTDNDNFQKHAYKLYQQLFPFVNQNESWLKNKKLIVVADDVLQNIPFETLAVSLQQPLEHAYLLQHTEISYALSSSTLIKSKNKRKKYANDFYAIVPQIFKDSTLSKLRFSDNSIEAMSSLSNKEIAKKHQATKNHFIEAYGKYKVMHISTHGGVGSSNPWLAFYDEKLELGQMYFSQEGAELVVLSACQTAQGEYKKGEGVMSIARDFINSGTNSVVASLWNIDQKANQEIIALFYKNIKSGKNKSLALAQAKRQYLQNHTNTSKASPYYWSAISLIGSDAPVILGYSKSYLYILLVLVLVPLLGYIYWKRIKEV